MKTLKTILFIALTITALNAQAQMKHLFNSESILLVPDFVDSVKALYPDRSVSLTIDDKYNNYTIKAAPNVGINDVTFYFKKFTKGANNDLEIAGTPAIQQVIVTGKYLDLFELWQKLFNKKADKVALQEAGGERAKVDGCGFWFKKNDTNWEIQTYYQPSK